MCPSIKNFLLKSGLVAFLVGLWLILSPINHAHADEVPAPAEQVVVSPAQQAVNTALATATTEVATTCS